MITRSICLVLGAGASVPYGFPTGPGLLSKVSEELRKHSSPTAELLRGIGYSDKELEAFAESLYFSGQPSVDAFLVKRPEYLKLGREAIVATLIPCEELGELRSRAGEQRWYQSLFQFLDASPEDFDGNRLSVVTLNYDRSLEYFLLTALEHSYDLKEPEAAKALEAVPIIHVYGQLGRPHFVNPEGRAYLPNVSSDMVKKYATEIAILQQSRWSRCASDGLAQALPCIRRAGLVCFLGFGYHDANIDYLCLDELVDPKACLLGSAYHLGDARRKQVESRFHDRIELGGDQEDVLTFLTGHDVLGCAF